MYNNKECNNEVHPDVVVERILRLGVPMVGRYSDSYASKKFPINNTSDLEFFNKNAKDENILTFEVVLEPSDKYPFGLICIDVDEKLVWEMLVTYIFSESCKYTIISSSTRGGHIIFSANKKTQTKIGALLNLGFRADVLTKTARVLGPGKKVLSMPDENGQILSILHGFCIYPYPMAEPLIKGTTLTEGVRNNSLFVWCSAFQGPYNMRCETSVTIGTHFCEPSLPISECISVIKEELEMAKAEEEPQKNTSSAEKIRLDTELVISKLKDSFIYVTEQKQMYFYIGTHWEALTDTEFMLEIEIVILNNADQYNGSITASNILGIASGYATRSKRYLKAQSSLFKFPPGKNFQNGYLVFEDRTLYPHSKSRFVTMVSDQNYNPNQELSVFTKKFFYDSLGGDTHKINVIRTAGYRALVKSGIYHSSYYLSGPPGSGKSSILNLYHFIVGPNAKSCELVDLENPFHRGEIVDCNLVIVNEFSMSDTKYDKQIKSFSGRDLISSTKKNVQGVFTGKFQGIFIITSNLGSDLTFKNSAALNDRFIPVEFVARQGKADPHLSNKLEANESGIINWLLSTRLSMMELLTRASLINKEAYFEYSVVAQFFSENLIFDKNSYMGVEECRKAFDSYLEERSLEYITKKMDFKLDLISACQTFYNEPILNKRREFPDGRKKIALIGIRVREDSEKAPHFKAESVELTDEIWKDYSNNPGDTINVIDIVPDQSESFIESSKKMKDSHLLPSTIMTSGLENLNSNISDAIIETPEIKLDIPKKEIENVEHVKVIPDIETPALQESHFKVKKKAEVKIKPTYAPTPFKQFPLPEKPSVPNVNKKTLTSVSEKPNFENKVVAPLSDSESNKIFEASFKKLCLEVINPLKKTQFEKKFDYHPHKLFTQTETVRKRILPMLSIGDVAYHFISGLGGEAILWFQTLKKAQEKNPLKENQKPTQVNLYMTKNHFTGAMVPRKYFWDSNGSPRLLSTPPHTIRDVPKTWRAEMFMAIARHSGTYIYDCDFTSCHARIVQLVISETRGPLLHKSFKQKDLYLSIAKKLVEQNPKLLGNIPIKNVRKLVKVKPLSMLNGGGIYTQGHISPVVDQLFIPESAENKSFLKDMTKILSKQPIVKEYKKHGDFLVDKKYLFTLTHAAKISCPEKPYILASPLMCAAETLVMTFLIEFLGGQEILFIPLTSLHDGIVLSTKTKLSEKDIEIFNDDFAIFLQSKINMTIPVEFDLVGEPHSNS